MDKEQEDLQKRIFQLENQISALSDQVWAYLRDGRPRMRQLCDAIDAGEILGREDLEFLRAMLGCLMAEISCREARD